MKKGKQEATMDRLLVNLEQTTPSDIGTSAYIPSSA